MKIVLDTNFLIYCIIYKIDFSRELVGNELFVTSAIKDELENISLRRSKEGRGARIALELIKSKGIEIISTDKNADESIWELSEKGYNVATLDEKLQSRINKKKVKIFEIKQKKIIREV